MNICEHLTATAKLFPDKLALVFEDRRYTFAELDRLSDAAANLLVESGVGRGDRVAILVPNVPAFVVWYYAALRIGALAVSISTRLTPAEATYLIDDCRAAAFVSLSDATVVFENEVPECLRACIVASELGDLCNGKPLAVDDDNSHWTDTSPNDPALILYTSGTTGFAKGATLSHMNVRSNVHAFNHLCNMQLTDRILLVVPLFHCFGQNALLNSAFNVGATIILQRNFDLEESKKLIIDEKVTQLYGVPMMFRLFHNLFEPADLSTVNYCFSAAATLALQTARRWQEKFGMPIHEGYGLTETSPFASYNHRLKFVPGSIGTPIDCAEMKIVDTETGADCPSDTLGEIAIRGPNVMLGYWNREEDTSKAIRDGWFHSGDIGKQDEHGYFYIVDRVKDMIAVGGLKVYPAEVERILLDHPAIAQAAVVGFPDEVAGEQVVAFIVLQDQFEASEELFAAIRQHAKDNLAHYKVPRHVKTIAELPRNPSGKVLKTELRKIDLVAQTVEICSVVKQPITTRSKPASPASHVSPQLLRGRLAESHANNRIEVANAYVTGLVQSITGSLETPDPETRFLDAGLDSMMIVEMSSKIQAEIGSQQEISATLIFDHPRICDLGVHLVQVLSPDNTDVPSMESRQDEPKQEAHKDLANEIAELSEEQALEELMKELKA